MAKKKKAMSGGEKAAVGVGLTAAAVAAAGAYLLYGSKDAAKNRKKVKGWMLKARGEVLEALERAEHITEREYNSLIESVAGVYSSLQNASKGEIADFKKEMKGQWKKLQKSGAVKKVAKRAMKSAMGKVKRATKKTAKKASKKTTKKSTKKTKK